MIAAPQIGRIAAEQLTDRTWTGHVVRELHGPVDLSFHEAAEILTEVLGRKIVFISCRAEEMRGFMTMDGLSENAVDLLLELYDAVDAGSLTTQPRSAEDHHDHARGVRPRRHAPAGDDAGGPQTK